MSKRLLFTLLGIAMFAGLSAQCSVVEVPLVTRVNASSLIVEGMVTQQYSYWNSNHTMIYTANKIELYKIFKGSVTTDAIEIITEGGTVDMDRIVVEPSLELAVGDEGIFTCIPPTRVKNNVISRNALPQYEAYASIQGFVKYNAADNTASDPFRTYSDLQTEVYDMCAPAGHHQYVEVRPRPMISVFRYGNEQVQAITSFSPTTVTAGTGTTITITGSGFGATQGSGTVGFKNSDDGGATYINPLPSQYISWSSTQIVVEVPAKAGTGTIQVTQGVTFTSSQTLTVDYAHLNVNFNPGSGMVAYQTDHINDNTSGGYTWNMNTGFDGNASARASFMRAFDTWKCGTLVNWSIGTTTSINDAVSDGTNVICFDNTAPLSSGILGVCYSYWSGCSSGPTIIWYVHELDIIFDEGSNITPLTWQFGPAAPTLSQYDFETVAVHELGHGHQLGHVIQPGAIMHYAISNGASNRSLGANDLAGGNFVQAKSIVANVCGPGPMTNASCAGSPPVANFSASQTTVCVGTTVNFTDLSTGSPTSWSWTFPGGSPASSALQNPSVFYSAPGTYNVTLIATNANGSNTLTMTNYITVNPLPTVGFTANPGTTLCSGTMLTLNGTGAVSYNWSGGVSSITNGVPFAVQVGDANLQVNGVDGNGCPGVATLTLTINPSPTLSVTRNPSNGIVCSGNQATLTASGAQSYSWTGGVTNAVPFTPAVSSGYTVTGTGANGCTSVATTSLTVQSCVVPTTQLTSAYCSATNLILYNWLYNTAVSGATNYQYLFTNVATSAQYSRIKGNSSPNMPLAWVAGIEYGASYYVQVRAYVNGIWGNYGPLTQCMISMAAAPPVTSLTSTYCPAFNVTHTTRIYCTAVTGASSYKFTITNAGLGYNQTRTSSVNNILMTSFSGILSNNSYTVTVTEFSGGTWSVPGAPCVITTGGSYRLIQPGEEDSIGVSFDLSMHIYPNPLSDEMSPTLNIQGADQKDAFVNVVDLTGRVVASYKLFIEGDDYTIQLSDFPDLAAGMYIMQLQVGDQIQSQRFVAE